IEAGINLRRDPVDFTLLTADVLGELGVQAEAKGVKLTAVLPPDSLIVAGDSGRLKQLLLNLIGNAIKYTPGDGSVNVTLLAESAGAHLTVRDSGIGIPAADLPFIFDKFYRVHTPETKEIKGTGLGLAIVHSIVEAHNGRITVTSTPIAMGNHGTTFTVALPQ
ncbi:MAG: HAMP domain-containing histidine kinase, partial [Myxococcales bacterium]|nr:HAMP domain-containing histidine kinase [Myxococcales bacterium]